MTTIVTPKPAILRMPVPDTEDYVSVPLDQRCGACGGVGLVYSKAWAAVCAKYPNGPIPEDEQPREPEEGACGECDGYGLVLTDFGRELLTFLRRHGL